MSDTEVKKKRQFPFDVKAPRGRQWWRPRIDHDGLHRYLWRRVDDRNRIEFQIKDIATFAEVCYDVANRAVIDMREEGRLRIVGYKYGMRVVYEVADPERWNLEDESTWARPRRQATWG